MVVDVRRALKQLDNDAGAGHLEVLAEALGSDAEGKVYDLGVLGELHVIHIYKGAVHTGTGAENWECGGVGMTW